MWNPNETTPIGKTYAQIDADEERYVQSANEALVHAHGQGACWWRYIVSHSTFELVVGDPLGSDNIVLCLNACDHIQGPTSWKNQNLIVTWHNSQEERKWRFVLADETVGFKIEAGTFSWRRNFDLVRYGSIYFPHDREAHKPRQNVTRRDACGDSGKQDAT